MEEKRRKIGKVDVMKGRGGEKKGRKGGRDEGRRKKERWMLKEIKMDEMNGRRKEGKVDVMKGRVGERKERWM